ncbi:hypothetical protein [Streptosporangium sp. NPDC002721]|uniref:hypothetical protein n=1 Tax=Streptosporangium sp. NPDC002721 TaxID=3366188 RepID=UPI0036C6820F
MSIRIRQAITVAAAGVAMIGTMHVAGAASAATALKKVAVTDAAHRAATTDTLQAKPCNKIRDCRRGYSDGFSTGSSCGKSRSSAARGFGHYQRGFDMGFERARDKFC